MKKTILILVVAIFISGCAGGLSQKHYLITQDYEIVIDNESMIAQEFFESRWPFYSGAIEAAGDIYPNSIPPVVMSCKEKLDSLPEGTELTLRQKGYVAVIRAFIVSEAFKTMIKELMPLARFLF